jgi:hypothetical protein
VIDSVALSNWYRTCSPPKQTRYFFLEKGNTRSSLSLIAALAAAIAVSQCGGGYTPSSPGSATPDVVTVTVVGTQGNGSFVPNPVPAGGNQVVFKNNDPVNTHHIIMDNGSVDFGNLAPGASSTAKVVSSGNFHCANHPSMVGSINGSVAPTPPPGSGDGY